MTAAGEADPALVEAWLRGRSMLRGLPRPVADSGGLRVETRQRHEVRRYVFAVPCDGLRRLADTIVAPRIFLKLCAAPAAMAPLLPPRWAVQPPGFLMTGPDAAAMPRDAPAGYALRLRRAGDGTNPILAATILAADGTVAAGGRAGAWGGVWLYDQIVTDPAHRRRGLARTLMAALASGRPPGSTQILVATADGRALYETLGWRVAAPYTTVVIPDGADRGRRLISAAPGNAGGRRWWRPGCRSG